MTRKARVWLIAGVAVVAVAVIILVLVNIRGSGSHTPVAAQPSPPPSPTAAPAETGIPAGVTLSTSDTFVRQVVSGLSSRPELVEWLANKDLVRRFVAAVALVAEGKSPASQLSFLRPHRKFHVRKAGGRLVAAPSSFHRYDLATEVFTSLDTAGTLKALERLKPLIDEAYAQISRPGARFEDALTKAITLLLSTPVIGENTPLKVKVVTYMYVDPRLEKLSPAQRLLLRMGPENERRIQAKLREFALALGIPAERLPEPVTYEPGARRHRTTK